MMKVSVAPSKSLGQGLSGPGNLNRLGMNFEVEKQFLD
jgi:hypothetical protein